MSTLDKLCRFLSTVRGTDKVFMLIQYSSKIINWHLLRANSNSSLVKRISNLANPISDFRILLRYYGLLPLIQWIIYSEQNYPATPLLHLLTRLQNVTNALYYPLEHVYWLALHDVIPMTQKTRDKIGMYSCRCWAMYVVLYFVQLHQEYRLLKIQKADLTDCKPSELSEKHLQINEQKNNILLAAFVNACYFPLTIHWSVETPFLSDVGVGCFGTLAAIGQLISTWKNA